MAVVWAAAAALIRPLAWEIPYAMGAALKEKGGKKKKKKKEGQVGASGPQTLMGEWAWDQKWAVRARRNQMSEARHEVKGQALASPTLHPRDN